MNRFDRNERFFGVEGQNRIRKASAAIVGAGGLGTHVIQQLAYLGVGRLVPIDPDMQEASNKNRNVGSRSSDPDGVLPKVDVAERLVREIDPDIVVEALPVDVRSELALTRLQTVDYVFGTVDNDGARLVLTEHALAFGQPYFDLATDTHSAGCIYGGRVFVTNGGRGCLVCQGELDPQAVREYFENQAAQRERCSVYGIPSELLSAAGPSVVSLNGVVASLGVTEFMVMAAGIRQPHRSLEYRADQGIVTRKPVTSVPGCYYCDEIAGTGFAAGTLRYSRAS